jgi:hypothetical protein
MSRLGESALGAGLGAGVEAVLAIFGPPVPEAAPAGAVDSIALFTVRRYASVDPDMHFSLSFSKVVDVKGHMTLSAARRPIRS